MMHKPPKYCQGFVDRHGKSRWYLRRPGFKRVALPGLPWTPQFMAAYEAAMAGETVSAAVGSKRTKPGSIAALVASYYQSTEYRNLKPITQKTYRSVMEPFREQHGDKPVAAMQREHVKAIVAKVAGEPDRPVSAPGPKKRSNGFTRGTPSGAGHGLPWTFSFTPVSVGRTWCVWAASTSVGAS